MNYRLYSFVANHYLSPLQCGLQTAHVVSEIFSKINFFPLHLQKAVQDWALKDKTIIICGAGNHKGVTDCWTELQRTGIDTGLVAGAIFHEDEQSMNFMATACGVIVPEQYWDVTYEDGIQNGLGYERYLHAVKDKNHQVIDVVEFPLSLPEGMFIKHIKSFRLA